MNMLIDELPTMAVIDGVSYDFNSDFRISIMFEMLMMDTEVADADKLDYALHMFYGDSIPVNLDAAVDYIMWFYRCGKEENKALAARAASRKRIYDYEYDDGYIYAAFLQQYGVDLQDEQMHWWKFRAMFLSLKDDTEFVKIMGYRSIKITSSMSKSQKEFYENMKRIHALPSPKNEVDKTNAIADALMNGGDVSALLGGG